MRKLLALAALLCAWAIGIALLPPQRLEARPRRPLLRRRLDAVGHGGSARGGAAAAARPRALRRARRVNDAELRAALREHAYLEGDFVLRSGRRSRYYLDKYRFETRPELLRPLGARIAAAVAAHDPEADLLGGPELGAVALAAAASLESGLPFLIVRKEAKEYGTGNRLEGVFEPGQRVCLVEDVVTSGGAACEAVKRSARPGSPAARRSAWSTARRAASTLWPATGSA